MSSVTGSSRGSLYNNNNNHGEDNIHSYSFAADDNLDDDDMIAIQEEEEEIAFRPSQPPALSQQQQYSPPQRQKPPPKVVRRRRRDNNNNNADTDASMTMMQASSQEFHTAASAAADTATKTATDVLNESSAFSFLQQLLDEPDQQQQQHDQNLSLSMSSHEDDDKAVPVIQQQTESTHDTNPGDAMRDEQTLSTAKTPKTNDDGVVMHNPRQSSTTPSQTPGNHRLDNHNQNIATSVSGVSEVCQQDDRVYHSNQNYKHSTGSTIHCQDFPHSTSNHNNANCASNDNDDSEKDQPSTSFWMNQEDDDNDEPSYMDTIRQNRQNEGHETTMARALQRQRHIQRQQQTRSHSPKQQQKSTPSSRRHRKDETSSVQPSRSLRQRLEKQRLIGGSTSTSNRNKMKSTRSVSADRMTRDERPSKVKRARSTSPNKQSSSRSKPQPVQKAKTSIVGHRPSHWGRNTSSTTKRAPSQRDPLSRLDKSAASRSKSRSSSRNSEDYQSQRQRKQLAAACATSHLLMPPPPARRRRQNNTHTALATPHSPIPNLLNISSISFKPDFLPQGHRNNPMDASGVADSPMEIDTYDDNASVVAESANTSPTSNNNTSATPNNNNTNNAASFLATVRANNVSRKTGGRKRLSHPGEDEPNSTNNRSSAAAGPLSRLLKQIKSELRIDGTRLRSGEYPFPSNTATGNSSRRFDMCDPRNRATSYMDVTLVGDTLVPWNTPPPMRGRQSTPRNFTLLGYIHSHHHYADRDPRTSTTAGDVDKSPVTISPDNLSNSFAWISLSSDTVQEHNLFNKSTPQGYQLRIYNAITTAIVAAEEEEKSVSNVNNKCRFSVLCTQLCEPYPTNILGVLQPELEQLVTSLPM